MVSTLDSEINIDFVIWGFIHVSKYLFKCDMQTDFGKINIFLKLFDHSFMIFVPLY